MSVPDIKNLGLQPAIKRTQLFMISPSPGPLKMEKSWKPGTIVQTNS